jgi:hypothetical protein
MNLKRIVFGAATVLVLALGATALLWAQTPPQADQPAVKPPAVAMPAAKVQSQWYSRQGDEIRARKLIWAEVLNATNETVGEVSDVILSKDGNVAAVVLGVGGFLGIGEHEVAVTFDSLRLKQDGDRLVVFIDATKDALKSAPGWTSLDDRSARKTHSSSSNRPSK